MQPLQNFLNQHFLLLCSLCWTWLIVSFGWRCYRRKRTGMVFPQVRRENIRFRERFASGYSFKTFFTRMGGARNCLRVTVTDAEVLIHPFFPFSVLAEDYDLEHRIPIASITNVQSSPSIFGTRLLLEYRDHQGRDHRLSLQLRCPNNFLEALGLPTRPQADWDAIPSWIGFTIIAGILVAFAVAIARS